ncbi:hypothetical protein PIB30_079337 [Stylosanthes scabra]|uniref:Uncharacterized protein n=1 Tax=Stylosanthes scabra TaxID=79078 RepID=A0ABU6YRF0_9FABA|nr:hypothetical protein [Stylosanthes scabra]
MLHSSDRSQLGDGANEVHDNAHAQEAKNGDGEDIGQDDEEERNGDDEEDSENGDNLPSEEEEDSADDMHFTDSEEELDLDDNGFDVERRPREHTTDGKGKQPVNEGFNGDDGDDSEDEEGFHRVMTKMMMRGMRIMSQVSCS